nr:MAG TPA: hypothetical protein [Caudoviricetes sp.]
MRLIDADDAKRTYTKDMFDNQLRNDKKQQADCILKLETELSQFREAAFETK